MIFLLNSYNASRINLDRPKVSMSSLIIFVSLFYLVSFLTGYLECLPKLVLAVLCASAHHTAWLTGNSVSRFGRVFWKRKSFLQGSHNLIKDSRIPDC